MPRYLIERNVGEITEEELAAVARRSNQVLEGMPHVRWIRSFYSRAEGRVYCEYEAPDPESILEHARRTGIPADRIQPVMLLDPAMYR